MDFTYEDLKNMSDEEVTALKRDLGKKLVRRIVVTTVVGIAAHVATKIVLDKFLPEIDETPTDY